jgi:hypothetical protein
MSEGDDSFVRREGGELKNYSKTEEGGGVNSPVIRRESEGRR